MGENHIELFKSDHQTLKTTKAYPKSKKQRKRNCNKKQHKRNVTTTLNCAQAVDDAGVDDTR